MSGSQPAWPPFRVSEGVVDERPGAVERVGPLVCVCVEGDRRSRVAECQLDGLDARPGVDEQGREVVAEPVEAPPLGQAGRTPHRCPGSREGRRVDRLVVGSPEQQQRVTTCRPAGVRVVIDPDGTDATLQMPGQRLNDPNAPTANSLVVAVVAVVRDAEGRLLMIERSDNGVWALPGGAQDIGESTAQAAVREVEEETGLLVEVTGICGCTPIRAMSSRTTTAKSAKSFRSAFTLARSEARCGQVPSRRPPAGSSPPKWTH